MKEKQEIIFEPRIKKDYTPKEKLLYDAIVIGGGPAGLAAAMYAARLGLKVLLAREIPGGTITLTGAIENYPGFVSIKGQKLAELLENHAMDYDIDLLDEKIEALSREKDQTFKARTERQKFSAKTIILATGAEPKKLGVKGEKEFFAKGVGYCALCDAAFFKNKVVGIVGGGDSAVKEAVLLTEYAKKVYLINNEKSIHPEQHNQKMLAEKAKNKLIEIINNNEIVEIKGSKAVEKIVLKNLFKGERELLLEGLFIYIGRNPNNNLAKQLGVKLNHTGEIIVNQHSETSSKGVFAAGDVTNTEWKQAITSVAQGVTAAYYAYQYLMNSKKRVMKTC